MAPRKQTKTEDQTPALPMLRKAGCDDYDINILERTRAIPEAPDAP